MVEMKRQFPVQFKSRPKRTVLRDHWNVVLEYENEGTGPWIVDLSHKTRWDFQDSRLDGLAPRNDAVAPAPGACVLKNRRLVNRMNATQAAVWHLGNGPATELSAVTGYTDVTEASIFLSLLGPRIFRIAEKLTALDFTDPKRRTPFLLQGPFSRVACQIVILARDKWGAGMILLTCARGYAGDMVHNILAAGATDGIRPAGEDRFSHWISMGLET
jgi:hypothetical protein